MIELLCGIISFVTATVSFLYGTRVAWGCGRRCHLKESPERRRQFLAVGIPAATALYLAGFLIVFVSFYDGFFTVLIPAATNAILLSLLLISMAMPEQRQRSHSRNINTDRFGNGYSRPRQASRKLVFTEY
ncbi:MAG: hypothetical protein P8Y96_03710 [Desulfuromonadales bacterium]|jgi:hypothetical protein